MARKLDVCLIAYICTGQVTIQKELGSIIEKEIVSTGDKEAYTIVDSEKVDRSWW